MAQKEYEMRYKLAAEASSFSSAFTQAQQTLTQTGEKVKELASLQSDVSAYERQQTAIEATKSKLDLLEQQYNNYQRELDETGTFSAKLANEQAKVWQQYEQGNAKLEQQEQKLKEMGDALTEAGVDTENLTDESERLHSEMVELKQQEQQAEQATKELGDEADKAGDEIRELGQEADNAGDKSEGFGDKATAALTAVGTLLASREIYNHLKQITEAFWECAEASGDFQAAMSNVEALSGASDQQMQQLTATAKELGATTKFTAEESAAAMGYMAMAGWDADQMLAGITGTMSLAAASGEDLATVSDIVTDSMTAFGLSAADAGRYADVLAATATNSNTNVSMLGETFKYAAPLAGTLGYAVEDVAVATGLMANAGIKGGEAGTTLRNMFTRLVKPTKESADAMNALGISLTDDSGRMYTFMELMEIMRDRFAGLTEQEQTFYAAELAGQRGMSGFLAVMNAAEGDFASLSNAITDCSGAAERMADIKLDNLNGQLVLLQSAWDGVKIAVGDDLSPVLSNAIGLLTDILGPVTEFINEHPALVTGIAAATAALTVATGAMVAFGAASMFLAPLGLSLGTVALGIGAIAAAAGGIGIVAGLLSDMGNEAEEAAAQMQSLSGQVATLGVNSDLIGEYNRLSEAVQDSSLSAEELAQKQMELDNVTAQLKAAYPELLGQIDAGTTAWNLQMRAIQDTINAEQAAAMVEFNTNAAGAIDNLLDLKNAYEEAQDAYQTAQDNMAQGFDLDVDSTIERVQTLKDELQEKIEAGEIYFDDQEYLDGVAELNNALTQLTGREVHIEGLSDVDSYLQMIGSGALDTSDKVQGLSEGVAEASNTVSDSYQKLSESQRMFQGFLESGITTMDGLREASGRTDLSLKDLGLTEEDVAAKVASGSMSASEAARIYGLYEQDVRMLAEAQRQEAQAAQDSAAANDRAGTSAQRSYREQLQLQYASQLVVDGYMDAEGAAQAFNVSVEDLTTYMEEQEDEAQRLANAVAAYESGAMSAAGASERFGVSLEDVHVESFENALRNLISTYGEVYTAAYESMSKQYSLWDEAAEVSATSMSTLQSNLQSQIDYWNNYNSNLAAVAQAAQSAGIDISGIWSSLSSGDAGAVAAVAGIAQEIASSADGGASSLQGYVDQYQELQDAMGNTAETIATNSQEVVDAANGVWDAVKQGMADADLAGAFSESAGDTLQGYIDAWTSGQGAVGDQLATDAAAWLEMFNGALGTHSPSTITIQSGVDTITGFVNGVDATAPDASNALATAGQNAITAFQAIMNASSLYSAGVAAMQGAINGINAMIPSLVAAARNAGLQAANAYKAAQDIHSPSKLFAWFSEMDIQGAIEGLEKNQDDANRAFAAAAESGVKAYREAYDGFNLPEIQSIVLSAELSRMLTAQWEGATSAVPAVESPSASDREEPVIINFSPVFNLEGVENREQLQEQLDIYTEELQRWLLDVVNNERQDAKRRAYSR